MVATGGADVCAGVPLFPVDLGRRNEDPFNYVKRGRTAMIPSNNDLCISKAIAQPRSRPYNSNGEFVPQLVLLKSIFKCGGVTFPSRSEFCLPQAPQLVINVFHH